MSLINRKPVVVTMKPEQLSRILHQFPVRGIDHPHHINGYESLLTYAQMVLNIRSAFFYARDGFNQWGRFRQLVALAFHDEMTAVEFKLRFADELADGS